MAGSSGRYVKSKSSNPFFDEEDDVDDEEFLKRAPNKRNNFGGKLANSLSGGSNSFQPLGGEDLSAEERRRQLLMEKQEIEQRTLQASSRAKGVLYETEQIGISTAEDLVRQREQLERAGNRLDEMNNSLRTSERHIQNIKSVFSSVKNYFSKPAEPAKNTSDSSLPKSSSSSSNLSRVLEQNTSQMDREPLPQQPHPALRIKGLENDFSHKPLSNVDEQLEQDLGDMSLSLSRLKGLAQGLNSELDDQNALIDRLQTSADKADWRIQRQNKDMERLLKK
uniref:EOG090X0MTI n=1 Tax=Ceriodaphnia reticulata TaxID=302197 RepID=A0A4Y7LYI2_9CRUS|nr:EOG090X0MTI [Ceriodaphnia reticulata]SVE73354.1 EOG090X0MTI [Ceriodaphnia reticulata]